MALKILEEFRKTQQVSEHTRDGYQNICDVSLTLRE